MEAIQFAGMIIGFLILVGLLIWLANDVWEDHGFNGCVIAGFIVVLTAPLFPFLFIGYLYLKHHYYGRQRTPEGSRREPVSQWTWRMQQAKKAGGAKTIPYITADESDESLDLMLAEGRWEEALRSAQDLLEIAVGFGDEKGILRYSKYVEYIKRGGDRI